MKFVAGIVVGVAGSVVALVTYSLGKLWEQEVDVFGPDEARRRLTRALEDPSVALRYITEAQYHYNTMRAASAEEELRGRGYQA